MTNLNHKLRVLGAYFLGLIFLFAACEDNNIAPCFDASLCGGGKQSVSFIRIDGGPLLPWENARGTAFTLPEETQVLIKERYNVNALGGYQQRTLEIIVPSGFAEQGILDQTFDLDETESYVREESFSNPGDEGEITFESDEVTGSVSFKTRIGDEEPHTGTLDATFTESDSGSTREFINGTFVLEGFATLKPPIEP